MKNSLIRFLVILVTTIVTFELTNLSLWLMCQPDTYLFYLGLILLLTIGFIGGYGLRQYGFKLYSKWKEKSNKKDLDGNN